jgi:hypothetical protein
MHAIQELFSIGLSCCVTFTLNSRVIMDIAVLDCVYFCVCYIFIVIIHTLSLLKNSYLSGCAVREVIFLYSTMIGT